MRSTASATARTGSSPTSTRSTHLHYAGLKDTLDATSATTTDAPRRHEPSFSGASRAASSYPTREHQAGLARVEAELEATVDATIPCPRMLRVAMSN